MVDFLFRLDEKFFECLTGPLQLSVSVEVFFRIFAGRERSVERNRDFLAVIVIDGFQRSIARLAAVAVRI